MTAPIPKFQTLITVEEFRNIVNRYLETKHREEYDPRDIKRFNEVDEYTSMFIQHGQYGITFDEDRALKVFHECMSWRKANHVYDVSTNAFPANYFDRKAIYYKNRDIYNHRLLHYVVRTFCKGEEDNEVVKRFITYNFERHIRRHPGEKIVVIFDLSNTGLKNLDYELVKFFISSIQIYYPGILAYMINFQMPFILIAAWKIIRTWLPAEAEQFIKFANKTSITQYVSPDQLSVAMGGTDTTDYVHIPDPMNDIVDDSMNANLKKKVTFADNSSLDLLLPSAPIESTADNEFVSTIDSPSNDELIVAKEFNHSAPLTDPSHTITRKSILQKPPLVNGCMGEEKIYHGLGIRPYDELIFESIESSTNGTSADCIQTLTLTNVGDKILTFKIKTTSPDKFRVKPGCSLLHPGGSATISVYLLKAYCAPTSNINKEKFLIIWTLIGHELKQNQLIDFWKTVPSSVLFEHRLKCLLTHKSTSVPSVNQSNDKISSLLHSSTKSDPSIVELQNMFKESMAKQETALQQTSRELKQIRSFLLIIFALLFLILLCDISKYFFSLPSSSVKRDL